MEERSVESTKGVKGRAEGWGGETQWDSSELTLRVQV